jgi:hypothetical protein
VFWLNVSAADALIPPWIIPAIVMIGMFVLVFYKFVTVWIFKM